MTTPPKDLPIIQKTYDLIKWYVPHLNKLPRNHKFNLGDRIIAGLYDILENLIEARYSPDKLPHLTAINTKLEVLRYQTRLLHDYNTNGIGRKAAARRLLEQQSEELPLCLSQQEQVRQPQQQPRFSAHFPGEHSSDCQSWSMRIDREYQKSPDLFL